MHESVILENVYPTILTNIGFPGFVSLFPPSQSHIVLFAYLIRPICSGGTMKWFAKVLSTRKKE